MFARAHQLYGQGSDVVGMARCIAAIGDTFCAPASSPEIWNLSVQESVSESSALTWKDQGRELLLDDIDEAKAREIYAEAAEMFRHAGCRRGSAAVMLRLSWLSVLHNDYRSACEHLEAASDMAKLSGDALMHALARVALQVARVGETRELKSIEHSKKSWVDRRGVWLGLPRLAGSQPGRQRDFRYTASTNGKSLLPDGSSALRTARNAGQRSASACRSGDFHAMVGDRPPAIVHYNEAVRVQAHVVETHPGLSNNVEMWHGRVQVQLYSMYEAEADPDGIERVIKALESRVRPTDPAPLAHLVSRFLGPDRRTQPVGGRPREHGCARSLDVPLVANQELAMTLEMVGADGVLLPGVESTGQRKRRGGGGVLWPRNGVRPVRETRLERFPASRGPGHKRDYAGAAAAYERHVARPDMVRQLVGLMQQSPEGALESRRQSENVEEQSAIFMLRLRQYERAQQHFDRLQELAGPEWWKRNSAPWASQSDLGETCEGLGQLVQALKWYESGIADLEAYSRRVSADEWKIALAGRGSSRFLYFYAARCALKLMDAAPTVAERREHADRLFLRPEAGRARTLLDVMGTEEADPSRAAAVRQLRGRISMWNSVLAGLVENAGAPAQINSYRTRLASDAEALLALKRSWRRRRQRPHLIA